VKLKEAILAAGARKGTPCVFVTIRAALTKPDATDLDECLADPTVSAVQIQRGLAAEGHRTSVETVRRHRRGECSCAK